MIHESAYIEDAKIGEGTNIWHFVHVRKGAKIGRNCNIGKGVYIDTNVIIGDNCKIQNYACIFHGTTLEDGVFLGPSCQLTNDKYPRAINPDGSLKKEADWEVGRTVVKKGASVGCGAVILPGLVIGKFSMVGAGSVVTKNISSYSLVYGIPARVVGKVDKEGRKSR